MKKNNILYMILFSLFLISIVVFLGLSIKFLLIKKESIYIIALLLVVIISILGYLLYKIIKNNNKTIKIIYLILIILAVILVNTLNIVIYSVDNTLYNITDQKIIYTSTIIVRKDSNIDNINDLNNKKIGISSNKNDYENYAIMYQVLKEKKKLTSNSFYKYDDMLVAIKDLLSGKIDALIISGNYNNLYEEYFPNLKDEVKAITKNYKKAITNKNKKQTIKVDRPFTVLVIGADNNTNVYNADVQILMTINPKSKKIVLVDVVRDSYVYNVSLGKWDKLTHTGWNGPKNSVDTVANLFDMKIDYYVKFNFNSVMDFVDMLGGINIDVPYRYLVYANKLGKGNTNYYINPGYQKLNGVETLMLARTRRMPGSSLKSRGKMQMKIIETVLSQVDTSFVINNFFDLYNNLNNNIDTNMTQEDIYYLLQHYISIINKFSYNDYTLEGSDSNYYNDALKQNLYTYKINNDSLKELREKLLLNLK